MSVEPVRSSGWQQEGSPPAPRGHMELGKQEFLMLLVAQLRNQDPLNPMQDREFIAQLAQLNALEQMQQVNETLAAMAELMTLGQVASFLGKQVSGVERGSGQLVEGTVTRVTIVDGTVLLDVGGRAVDVRDVVSVASAPGEPSHAGDTGVAGSPADAVDDGQGGIPATAEPGTDGGDSAGAVDSDASSA